CSTARCIGVSGEVYRSPGASSSAKAANFLRFRRRQLHPPSRGHRRRYDRIGGPSDVAPGYSKKPTGRTATGPGGCATFVAVEDVLEEPPEVLLGVLVQVLDVTTVADEVARVVGERSTSAASPCL